VKERLVYGNAMFWIDDEHFAEQIASLRCLQAIMLVGVAREENVGKETIERVALITRPVFDVVPHCRLEALHE
jgi:hypothetical protein